MRIFLISLIFFFSSVCNAQLVTWNFSASISQKIGSLPEISLGDEITGSITFRSDAKDDLKGSKTEASYRAIDNIRLNVLDNEIISKKHDTGFNKILIRNNHPIGDSTDVEDVWFLGRALNDPTMFVNELTPIRISFFFIDRSANVFESLDLPIQPLSPNDFTSASGSLRFMNAEGFIIILTLDDIVFTPNMLAQ